MLDPTWAIWLNRVGLLLDFLAFWFAAPEILGEERLRGMERVLEKLLRGALRLARLYVGEEMIYLYPLAALLALAVLWFVWPSPKNRLGAVVGTGASLFMVVVSLVVPRWLRRLADDSRARRRFLTLGAFMFMLGFALQLVATF